MSAGESQNVPGPGDDRACHERGSAGEAAHPDDAMTHFAEFIVNRLFSVGLSLDSAHSILGKGFAGDRVAVAAGSSRRYPDLTADQARLSPRRGSHTGRGRPRV